MRFEIVAKDAMGRIGRLQTPHGTVETPALLPVINPNIDFIPAHELRKYGAEMMITNSYIIYRSRNLRERALKKGLHGLLGVDMPVMTDSGSFQLMVYGDVEVTNEEIVRFQNEIGSDIVTPLDIPTPPDAEHETARKDLEETIRREREAEEIHESYGHENLLSIPIQGSTHLDLRKRSAEAANSINGDVFAVGAVVPLLDTYRFSDVAKIVLTAKSVLTPARPVHLFGAGHPMIFALYAAMGVDLFDSAAYALFAKDDRYLTPRGTLKLEELQYFPCSCPVCLSHTPEELRRMEKGERARLIAEHNLYVSFEEIRRVKQAIKSNELFELVENRIRAHPYLVQAWREIRNFIDVMERHDPSMKRVFFYLGRESLYRPAIRRHHERVLNVKVDKDEIVISSDPGVKADFYLRPAFGVVPAELMESYPAGHAEMYDDVEDEAYEVAAEGLRRFMEKHRDKRIRLVLDDRWRRFVNVQD
ncbi:tRNA-guanine{15} transglycosylase [Geoglobus ahangari]|uniref:tRNA-guanine(15) transglycosylase n=1 Tax=Geoglobus ahangari TaxID=113653 RepID=A0A0F7DC13_9EURY|nr:tRNA guanosine(15) transglycosylase TgtA [Geoglobus ahangari]AKG92041.1 tRNA-guanine{15} transglycosylase [Geoglobus ahangari]